MIGSRYGGTPLASMVMSDDDDDDDDDDDGDGGSDDDDDFKDQLARIVLTTKIPSSYFPLHHHDSIQDKQV